MQSAVLHKYINGYMYPHHTTDRGGGLWASQIAKPPGLGNSRLQCSIL